MNKRDLQALTPAQLQGYRDEGLLEILDLPLAGLAYVVTPDYPGRVLEMRVDAAMLSPFYGSTYSLYTWIDGARYSLDVKMPRGMVWPTLAQALKNHPDHTLLHFTDTPPYYIK